jgi:hypothetical protein
MSAGPAVQKPDPTPDGPTSTPLSPPPPAGSPIFTFIKPANCRKGPNTLYESVGFGEIGQQAQIEGISHPPIWYYVLLSDGLTRCFVAESTGDIIGLVNGLPVIPDPPLPVILVTPPPPFSCNTAYGTNLAACNTDDRCAYVAKTCVNK